MAKRLETLLAGGALALALTAAPVHADGMTSGGQASNGGWYAGLFAGVAWPEDWDLNEVDRIEMDTGFALGGVVGTQVRENVRVELEVSNWSADGACTVGKCGISAVDMDALSVLGNAWLDIPVDASITPYVGAGLGITWVALSGDGVEDTGSGFAWQLGAGFRSNISTNVVLDVGYRFKSAAMDQDDYNGLAGLANADFDAQAHVLQAGVNFRF
jgi:opacity protein-like surface antigen